jgi:uncharacterized protein YcfJ
MNQNVLIAFLAGVLLAGAGGYFLASSGNKEEAPAPTPLAQLNSQPVEPAVPEAAQPAPVESPAQVSAFRPAASERPRRTAPAVVPAGVPMQSPKVTPAPELPMAKPAAAPAPSALPPAPEPEAPKPVAPPPPRVAKTISIPAGTVLDVRINESLSSATNKAGDDFTGSLSEALIVDGLVLAERGARVSGRVASADPGGRVKGRASLVVELVSFRASDGQTVRIDTQNWTRTAESSRRKDATKVGVGAAIGAAIGAIAGGGKGAAIGGAAGGAAGGGVAAATRGEAAEIDSETRIPFRLNQAVSVTEKLKN